MNKNHIKTSKILTDIQKEIQKEINDESKIIETLPHDLECHLWCRRGLLIAQRIIQDKLSERQGLK